MINALKETLKKLKQQTLTVYFVSKHPDLPLHIKLLAVLVVAYALSPIDLIPDFIPVIGYLDDVIIVSLGIALVLRLTPKEIIVSSQLKAEKIQDKPKNYIMAIVIILIWLVIFGVLINYFYPLFGSY